MRKKNSDEIYEKIVWAIAGGAIVPPLISYVSWLIGSGKQPSTTENLLLETFSLLFCIWAKLKAILHGIDNVTWHLDLILNQRDPEEHPGPHENINKIRNLLRLS